MLRATGASCCRAGQGFENKIAQVIAQQLGDTVSYTWWAQRRGFARNTLKGDLCDIWPGVATGVEMLATTRPYYRSTYVFVTRTDRHLYIASFDDPRLRQLRIGVQMIGNDAQNTPPTHALARRGIVNNVRGYLIYGDYRAANPPEAIIDAVDKGDVDVAVVWGPLAGYFAQQRGGLDITPVHPAFDGPQWPMVFNIAWASAAASLASRLRLMLHCPPKAQRLPIFWPNIMCPWSRNSARGDGDGAPGNSCFMVTTPAPRAPPGLPPRRALVAVACRDSAGHRQVIIRQRHTTAVPCPSRSERSPGLAQLLSAVYPRRPTERAMRLSVDLDHSAQMGFP
jgi:mxaJ protein